MSVLDGFDGQCTGLSGDSAGLQGMGCHVGFRVAH